MVEQKKQVTNISEYMVQKQIILNNFIYIHIRIVTIEAQQDGELWKEGSINKP